MPAAASPAVAGAAPLLDGPADFELWERELAAAICTHPVRLRGEVHHINPVTGEAREVYSTDDEPTSVLLKPCGTRRAAICPACAERYRRDAYHLLAAGLRGGKSVPASVAAHPRLFVTLTAPSFGPVHARRDKAGRVLPCRPRRHARPCPHGRPTECRLRHRPDDPRIGQPLCGRCYQYPAHVLWNALAPELWRRTRIYLDRAIAQLAGLTVAELRGLVRVEYAKVAEYQARGVIHYHAVIRLDAQAPQGLIQPPPTPFTAELLETAIRHAAATVTAPVPGTRRLVVRWGTELRADHITSGATGPLSAELVAGYIAKYATKATETF
ncbi:MAG TPA: replication initiator, partial [Actinomycetes bacterium]|nr:replication initiator [Actinomycetes bacterium]